MTGRNTTTRYSYVSRYSARAKHRGFGRVLFPLLVITATVGAAGCMQGESGLSHPQFFSALSDASLSSRDLAGLGQDAPSLGMLALIGPEDPISPGIRIFPLGNVPRAIKATESESVSSTTLTHWVKNPNVTSLWSGPHGDARAFTDIPAGTFLRVVGPPDAARIPVYYYGDGMLRRAGNGWVDAAIVQTVDAPAPGQVTAVDADARAPLPLWVQAHRATTLWSGPDDKAVNLTDLPQWTFLKVAGIERGGRILVAFAGDYANREPGIGWVDNSSVGPAGDPGTWVTNHRAATLWSGTDAAAVKFNDLPQWTKLRVVESAPVDTNRLQVQFFGDGGTRAPGTAWIARADIGPITPPNPLPALTTLAPAKQSYSFASDRDFISAVGDAARGLRGTTRVPASVTVAQAILESDWGRSRLTRQGNNLFGIKALNGAAGPAGVVTLSTWEHVDGADVVVQAPFRAYYSLQQSIDDHARFLSGRRYAGAIAVADDPRAFAHELQSAGYATDPSYATKLISLMDRYNLYRFDS